jgi:hypothetical protein
MDMKEAAQAYALELTEIKTRLPGQDTPAYYKPATLAHSAKLNRRMKAEGVTEDAEKLAVTFIESVLDAEGKPLFDRKDRHFVMNGIPQDVILDIVNEISSSTTIEDAEGN